MQPTIKVNELVDNYIDRTDWRVNENANAGYSYASLLNHISGAVLAVYTLDRYPEEIRNAHRTGAFHLHDLSGGIIPYCSGWSLRDLLEKGFIGIDGRASAAPAKHFDTVTQQICNFLCTLQTEFSGAQAFSSFDTLLAPFVREDQLSYRQVKQAVQQMVFGLNIASRWGQSPFTNLTFDWTVPEDLKDTPVIIAGRIQEGTRYGDYQREMDMINRAFIEVMMAGDRDGRIFTFPIPTYNITKDFDWDSPIAELLFKMTGKYGLPYFQNFINSDLDPKDVRSMCCRLQMDMRELRNKTGGLFGSGELTGSIGVVTLNLPRLGYQAKDQYDFITRLYALMDTAMAALEIKRSFIKTNFDRGLMPYSRQYLHSFDHHFSTIGLVGMHEACLNLLGSGIDSKEGHDFALIVLDAMRHRIIQYQKDTGNLYNLEATPAEGTCYRLAKIDLEEYSDIHHSGDAEAPYYTNSSNLPVGHTSDVFEALSHQEMLQQRYTGGTVFHIFTGECIDDAKTVKTLLRIVATNYKIPYFTLTGTFSICPKCGYMSGEHFECPTCHGVAEVFSRVTGYHRPVQNWNHGKRKEFSDRKEYGIGHFAEVFPTRTIADSQFVIKQTYYRH